MVFETASAASRSAASSRSRPTTSLIANLDPTLDATAARGSRSSSLAFFPEGLCTQEVAVLLAGNLIDVDRAGAEDALIALVADGRATREPLGNDAIWRAA